MTKKKNPIHEDWRERLEAMRQNINTPHEIVPEFIKTGHENENTAAKSPGNHTET